MDDEAAFLRAILDDTADNVARLAYADWLEEHGRYVRARFIRDQIAGRTGLHDDLKLVAEWDLPQRDWIHTDDATINTPAPVALYRRGFVDEIRLPMAAFVGGVCPACDGAGWVDLSGEEVPDEANCDACGGTGRVSGLAKDVFSRHPVTRVVLTDRRPGAGSWWKASEWVGRENNGWPAGDLPDELFDLMAELFPDNVESDDVSVISFNDDNEVAASVLSTTCVAYDDNEVAASVLSTTCVAYGRSLAFPKASLEPA